MSNTPTYVVWAGMKQRCFNQKSKFYSYYGGRGITICNEWKNDFSAFLRDMGERPDGTEINRKNNDGNYEPENCEWASRKEQQNNRRANIFVTYQGKRFTLSQLSETFGVHRNTIDDRLSKGLSIEEAISKEKLLNMDGLALGAKASSIARKSKTHCAKGHEFTEENSGKSGVWRYCKRCHADREIERRHAKK